MNWLDMVFILLIVVGAAYGAWKGFIMLAATAVAITLGIAAAGHLGESVANFFNGFIDSRTACGIAGFAVVFLGVAALVFLAAFYVRKGLYKIKFGGADRSMGAIIGIVAAALLCIATLLACVNGSDERMLAPVRGSKLAPGLARTANTVRVWISQRLSTRIQDYLDARGIDLNELEVTLPGAAEAGEGEK